MLPSELRECALIDIGEFILGNVKREKWLGENKRREIYNQAELNYIAFCSSLAHLTKGGRKAKFPSFEEVFSENIRKEKEQKGIYTKIDKENASEFLSKQLKAYRSAGYYKK